MTELFYDESNNVLQELRREMAACKGKSAYEQDTVQSVFRGVHTLKASSTMMLFENLSELSKSLEQMLFCFRGEGKKITDTHRFDEILVSYVDFFERETDKLSMGQHPEAKAEELGEKIKSFTEELTGQMAAEEIEAFQERYSKPKRQIYYIAGVTEEAEPQGPKKSDGEKNKKEAAAQPQRQKMENIPSYTAGVVYPEKSKEKEKQEEKVTESSDKPSKKYIISEDIRELIFRGTRNLQRVLSNLEYAVDETGVGEITQEQLERLREIEKDFSQVKKFLTKADFVPVAKKMKVVLDEMSMKLGKRMRLLVEGEHIPVDSEMRDKISNALIHVIRNAADHGIEDMDERERLGKAPVGLIRLKFFTQNGALRVSVEDDGKGIDTEAILKNAEGQGILKKPSSDYSREEVYELMLESGVTTTETANDYSGRGVGMDVIAHTVEQLGGKLEISSEPCVGTTITMKF